VGEWGGTEGLAGAYEFRITLLDYSQPLR